MRDKKDYTFITNFEKESVLDVLSILELLKLEKEDFVFSNPYVNPYNHFDMSNYISLYVSNQYMQNHSDFKEKYYHYLNILIARLIAFNEKENLNIPIKDLNIVSIIRK